MPPGPITQVSRSRSTLFPLIGLLLASGAPLGLLLVRLVASEAPLSAAWVAADLAAQGLTYGYLSISTSLVFATLGWIVGRQEDQLRRSSITDPLTGLVNRRHWSERLAGEVDRARRYRTPLSVMILDVDDLKRQNDREGHEAGDRALCRVAEALREGSRSTDVVARYGGDEFAVLAPHTRAAEAFELAQRILVMIRARSPGPVRVTASIGVADLDCATAPTAEAVCRSADGALYLAKRAGRDRALVAPRSPREGPRAPEPAGEPEEEEDELHSAARARAR